jgi:hypothetical protein
LRRSLQSQLDQIEDDTNYSPQIERQLRADLSRIRRLETMLIDGIRMLAQRVFVRQDNSTFISTACHWFALYTRRRSSSGNGNIQDIIACDVWPEHERTYEQNVLIWGPFKY